MKLTTKLLLLTTSVISSISYTQTLFSNGASLSLSTGSIVHVNGGIDLSQTSSLSNNGALTITKNSTLPVPGNLIIGAVSQVNGNGGYFVEQDWVNNGTFNAGTSTVTLYGNTQQFITSLNAVATVFNQLILTGTGTGNDRKKTLNGVNASTGVTGILQLNDRELETQTNTFFVLNPSVTAVTYLNTFGSEGFVSSLAPGTFSRVTNQAAVYIFPTGSSAVTLRFRPVELTPSTNAVSQYTARLNNVDATIDNFDRTQTDDLTCSLNPNYYHSIERPVGSAPTDLRLFYVSASDGNWPSMAQWQNPASEWTDMGTTNAAVSGGFDTRTKAGWNFTVPGHPYILSRLRPDAPQLNCPDVCENSVGNSFTLTGTTNNYQWTFPSNASLVSGQGTTVAEASWQEGPGQVSVVAIDGNGCSSLPAICTPNIIPNAEVDFSFIENGSNYQFTDHTSGAVSWSWDFGDGFGASVQAPSHTYSGIEDSYLVTLEVTNANGCVGQGTKMVELFSEIVVPNIFTPDNDGINDVFFIKAIGVKEYDLQIFNRWGNLVFTSNSPNVIWDGKSHGKLMEEGVYFYKLKASSNTKEYHYQGNITLIRN